MSELRGMLNVDALSRAVTDERLDTVIVSFTDHYGRQMGKRVDASFFLDEVASSGTHACDYLLTVDMEIEPVEGYDYANWQLGYGDFHLVPDLATLRVASWLDRSASVICDVFDARTHEPVDVAPRSVLRRQLQLADDLGYRVMAASELEYFLFDGTYADAEAAGFEGLDPSGWYIEDYHLLQGTKDEPYHGTSPPPPPTDPRGTLHDHPVGRQGRAHHGCGQRHRTGERPAFRRRGRRGGLRRPRR